MLGAAVIPVEAVRMGVAVTLGSKALAKLTETELRHTLPVISAVHSRVELLIESSHWHAVLFVLLLFQL